MGDFDELTDGLEEKLADIDSVIPDSEPAEDTLEDSLDNAEEESVETEPETEEEDDQLDAASEFSIPTSVKAAGKIHNIENREQAIQLMQKGIGADRSFQEASALKKQLEKEKRDLQAWASDPNKVYQWAKEGGVNFSEQIAEDKRSLNLIEIDKEEMSEEEIERAERLNAMTKQHRQLEDSVMRVNAHAEQQQVDSNIAVFQQEYDGLKGEYSLPEKEATREVITKLVSAGWQQTGGEYSMHQAMMLFNKAMPEDIGVSLKGLDENPKLREKVKSALRDEMTVEYLLEKKKANESGVSVRSSSPSKKEKREVPKNFDEAMKIAKQDLVQVKEI